jgi:hypothetical protein
MKAKEFCCPNHKKTGQRYYFTVYVATAYRYESYRTLWKTKLVGREAKYFELLWRRSQQPGRDHNC